MKANDQCILCKSYNQTITGYDVLKVQCKSCGTYNMTEQCWNDIPNEKSISNQLYKISAYTLYRSIHGMPTITLCMSNDDCHNTPRIGIREVIDQFPKLISDRMDKALLNLAKLSKFSGARIPLDQSSWAIFYPDSKDSKAFFFIMQQLVNEDFIEGEVMLPTEMVVTVKGWKRVYELEKGNTIESNRGFIAMWFDSQMDTVSENGFKRAIKDAGFDPVRIDSTEHNGKIDDQIIAEIRHSKFVVCDFTGHRGGVYFEAGFAMGLGLPVIWCCRSDHFKDIHFDTRQYNHIEWSTEDELYTKLLNRIRATIN